jgi:hypothetical protein
VRQRRDPVTRRRNKSSSTQRRTSYVPELVAASAFAACTPCQMIVRSVSSELVRLLTKLSAFSKRSVSPSKRSVSPVASGIRFKTQDHNFSSDSINRLWSRTERALFDHVLGAAEGRARESLPSNPIADRGCRAPPHACDHL